MTKFILLGLLTLLPACGALESSANLPRQSGTVVVVPSPTPLKERIVRATTRVAVTNDPEDVFRPLMPFDGIPPIYDPQFASASQAPLREDELVLGIALGTEAKAYPISVLRFREIVNDELAGIPILVTW